MIIQHNIMALNSHRQLGANNTTLSKNLEKLSSGYRINKAADDAAGLAISEKMRAQITGLERASLNAKDGASLIQTAEGGLQEVHGMLNRMVELATQSANGTIQADDRQKIESELGALKEEIDRISKATNFNGINLLDGSLGKGSVVAAAGQSWSSGNELKATSFKAVIGSITGMSVKDGTTFTITTNDPANNRGGIPSTANDADYITIKITGKDGNETHHALKLEDIISFTNPDGSVTNNFKNAEVGAKGTIDLSSIGLGKAEITVTTKAIATDDIKTVFSTDFKGAAAAGNAQTGTGLTMQVGDTPQDFNHITVSVDNMSSEGLGIKGISMADQAAARLSLDKIKSAIEKVSVNRGNLGALQNRLDHTISNLGVTSENMTAAESRIRDVDMAKEMMQFTKNNVLAQAAQAMLAQANQQPQQVLQLLR